MITTDVETVTPQLAEEWLAQNDMNRPVRRAYVGRLARDMAAGQWRMAGDPIRFDINNKLLDGQHRLHAVRQACLPIQFVVIRGLEPDTKDVMDIGAKRTVADALKIDGYEGQLNRVAAIGRHVLIFDTGTAPTAVFTKKFVVSQFDELHRIAIQLGFFERQEPRINGGAILGAAIWRCTRVDQPDAQEFFDRLLDGAGLPLGSPILSLRGNLIAHRFRAINDSNSLKYQSTVFHVWNYWREGRSLKRIFIPNEKVSPR